MPKYELMYIIGSEIADSDIPKVTDEIKKIIESHDGLIEKYEELGKKKLAYPIKKTKNGYYVLTSFSAPAEKINDLEHRIRTSQTIIRHLIVNMDEALIRMEKDRTLQAKLKLLRPKMETPEPAAPTTKPTKPERKIEIDLDAEIEKALKSEDLK